MSVDFEYDSLCSEAGTRVERNLSKCLPPDRAADQDTQYSCK